MVVCVLLLVPECTSPAAQGAGAEPFLWGQDDLWQGLETEFNRARDQGCDAVDVASRIAPIDESLTDLEVNAYPPNHRVYRELERRLFGAAPTAAACPAQAIGFLSAAHRLRSILKRQSQNWEMGDRASRDRIYRLLYGARAAVEEVILQSAPGAVPLVREGEDVSAPTPSTVIRGVRIHSGDVLVSRGGAPTSALIARGNDYPGNFSHIALAHVDPQTGEASVIEAHIEVGVVIASAERYLEDTKLRVMVLRLRPDLPELQEDPMLPHIAATAALREAADRHIAYDFAMDYQDPEEQFCSEVASAAYASQGVELWSGLSSMSGAGLTRWLSRLGVTHFVTHSPSDLEYDPQLSVVAEWRDPDLLFEDHVDNAVVDAMLEGADRGDDLDYSLMQLPFARLAKGWSLIQNLFGEAGPVPEGMSATVALRVQAMRARHGAIKERVMLAAEAFVTEAEYRPPYWVLVEMAREAAREVDAGAP